MSITFRNQVSVETDLPKFEVKGRPSPRSPYSRAFSPLSGGGALASRLTKLRRRDAIWTFVLVVILFQVYLIINRKNAASSTVRFGSSRTLRYIPNAELSLPDSFQKDLQPVVTVIGTEAELSPAIFMFSYPPYGPQYMTVHVRNEGENFRLVKHLIKTGARQPDWESPKRPPIFLDVGSNHGGFALYAAQVDPYMVSIAIEPQSRLARLVVLAARTNGLADRIRVLNCAVHTVPDLQVGMKQTWGDGGIGQMTTSHELADPDNLLVPTVRIDQLVAKEDRILIMKVDVESYEVIALRSALPIINQVENILVEWGPENRWANESKTTIAEGKEILSEMMSSGFSLKVLFSLCWYGFDDTLFPPMRMQSPFFLEPVNYRSVPVEHLPVFVEQFHTWQQECYLWLHR
mmetsp:Transcript_35169/g.56885  ORF Transcript_35169/g.56885 Transcript_35169/m.56885 type:complete len:405 (+) Transcript_35169:146-1360(+)